MFGVPIRVAKTSSRDSKDRKILGSMMENMGHNAWGVFGEDTEISLVETAKSDSYNVYDKRIERANSELSKLILQQTMTIDDGSSRSQSETHLDVFENLITSLCEQVRDTVNTQLIPRMVRLGFPVQGYHLEWDDPENYTADQKIRILELLLANYKVPASYINDTYGIPVEEKEEQPSLMHNQAGRPFFD